VDAVSYTSPIQTLTFLFTDIEGSTALLRRLGDDGYAKVLADHHRIIRAGLRAHDGIEHGTQGDSFFASFGSASASVLAAIEVQRALSGREWPPGEHVRVRMGLHTGEASTAPTGLVGYEVHHAARIAAVAHGGQVLASASTVELVRDSLPSGVTLQNLGTHRLKDLGRPEELYQLIVPGLRSDFPPLHSLDNPEMPNNLPAYLSPFVGRTSELTEVRCLVLQSKLVTLTGVGGAGKTRLALQVSAELLDGKGDGVWFVDLAPVLDPDRVPAVVVGALELRSRENQATADALARI